MPAGEFDISNIDPKVLVAHFKDVAELDAIAWMNVDETAGFAAQQAFSDEMRRLRAAVPALGHLGSEHFKYFVLPKDWSDEIDPAKFNRAQGYMYNRGVSVTILAIGRALGITGPVIEVQATEAP